MRLIPALAALLSLSALPLAAEPVSFAADDGVVVHADYNGKGGARPLILLFHQAGSNRHEYDPIAPRLNAAGFDTLAVDQRSGGSAFGFRNETAEGAGGDYLDAYRDLEAALEWGRAHAGAGGIIAWGSSYSAALVFVLAEEHPGHVKAVLAFSPGEYFGDPDFVKKAAAGVGQPVFASSASDPGEIAQAAAILAEVRGAKTQAKPKAATHGASALREDVNPGGAEEIWGAVLAFLDQVK